VQENKTSLAPAQVLLVIENRLVRETLVRLFSKLPDLLVVGQGCADDEAGSLDGSCDIVVVDDLQTAAVVSTRCLASPRGGVKGIVLIGMEEHEGLFSESDPRGGYGLSAE